MLPHRVSVTLCSHRSAIDERDVSKSRLLFPDDLFMSPSYFEFDEYNEVLITFCAHKLSMSFPVVIPREYKLWLMSDYSFLYAIQDPRIEEIKIGYANLETSPVDGGFC